MSVSRKPGPNNEAFFVTGPETGIEHPAGPYVEAQQAAAAEGAVHLLGRNLDLQHTVRLFVPIDEAARTDRVFHAPAPHDALVKRFGEAGVASIAARAKDKHTRLLTEAKQHFARAFGLDTMVSLGMVRPLVAKARAKRSFDRLEAFKYGDLSQPLHMRREGFLRNLVQQEVVLATSLRKPDEPEEAIPEISKLTDWEKFLALRDDPRAGFIPASNSEKTHALTILSYLDDPKHPLGSVDQLHEVFGYHMKKAREEGLPAADGSRLGMDALRSIPLVYGDYLINSMESINNLRGLELVVRECLNPRVTLIEDLGELGTTPGVLEVIRFIEQSFYVETGEAPADVGFSLFRSHENRPPEDQDKFKHKTIEDPYTRETLSKGVEKHLQRKNRTLKIGDIRKVIGEAIEDQLYRAMFWEARMQETRAHVITWRSGKWVLEKVQSLQEA